MLSKCAHLFFYLDQFDETPPSPSCLIFLPGKDSFIDWPWAITAPLSIEAGEKALHLFGRDRTKRGSAAARPEGALLLTGSDLHHEFP